MKNIDVMEKLEKYCQMSITISREYSSGWIFGAIDFACYAGLIDLRQRGQLLKKYQSTVKMDPSGGNRTGSSK